LDSLAHSLHYNSLQTTRNSFRKLVRKRKQEWYSSLIAAASPGKPIWKVAAWRKITDRFQPPPIIYNNTPYTSPQQRATILQQELFNRYSRANDISYPDISLSSSTIPFPLTISPSEAYDSIAVGNTTPGADGILTILLKLAWPSIESSVTLLYNSCLSSGYFPNSFKEASVIMIPKPNKDHTTIKGWRPISLLSCLGKGLERIVAKRLSKLAILYKILSPTHFGALPGRSAVDLAACVVNDIEAARYKGLYSALFTLDVSGAFDILLKN
jgi:Reverse transcriptase (RNA-dependent DNA polymerase)